jgi:endonuclease-3 related protein
MNSTRRLRKMHDTLFAAYGPQEWWPARTRFEVILGAYLTQNTSWTSVELSLANLRKARALSLAGIRHLTLARLTELIRPSGFATRKAAAIRAFVQMIDREYSGSLSKLAATPATTLEARLLALPGVGPETAHAILLYALDHPTPVADEYLRRIVERHALLPNPLPKNRRTYDQLHALTRAAFAADPAQRHHRLFNEFHALTVVVGKAHCGRTARCAGCPLAYDLENSCN